ncbi:anti-sigma factor family protein [Merismopedia glauca]|uniref:Fis family transcriptional regulator n=1 Tax=Merismopedia glauca CCAP 1448/3 TaxID=1296344 RepID=A0A2T1BWY5_9CYAN|nr:zf-HC2 domain-containing protein [Merismopedia glauca]PSB00526.1 Fis family transcriptional regulator [Merismopedia glauca CCAP 1448/3]
MIQKREPSQNQHQPEPNSELRSQFELLSAYLDGEVTAAERRQVQQWLESDGKIQKLYARLVKLRHTMRSLPVPTALVPIEDTIEQVFIKLNRTRWRRLSLVGGTAIAAMALAGLGSIFSQNQSPVPQLAQSSPPEALMVALNKPPIEIPKPAIRSQKSEVRSQKSGVQSW